MHATDEAQCADLLREILALHPEGLSEYELLSQLRGDSRSGFAPGRSEDPQDLFRTHFLLFHLLYRLRDELRREQTGDLEIHTLKIRWLLSFRATRDRQKPGSAERMGLRLHLLICRGCRATDKHLVFLRQASSAWRQHHDLTSTQQGDSK